MGVTLSTRIKDVYANKLKNDIATANQKTTAAKMPYQYNVSQADSMYQPQRNDAYTKNAFAQKALRERMANFGLGGGGGASTSAQQNLRQDFLSGLNAVNLGQQKYVDEQNTAMSQLDAQNAADIAGLRAQNELEMQQALIGQGNTEFDRALQLFLSGRIDKKQFQKLTGYVW